MKNLIRRYVSMVMILALIFAMDVIPARPASAATTTNCLPITAYTLNGKVNTYTSVNGAYSGYIAAEDKCTILGVYDSGWLKVEYPVKNGKKTAYVPSNAFFCNVDFSTATVKAGSGKTVYTRSDMGTKLGSVYAEDNIIVVGDNGTNTQIIYPITGGYKLGWVSGLYQTAEAKVVYRSHVAEHGWLGWVDSGISGTVGEARRMEALQIRLEGVSGSVDYRVYSQDLGWRDWSSNGDENGTTGQSRRIEALQIQLSGTAAASYDILYRIHQENVGWTAWVSNGAQVGLLGLRIEAIEIRLAKKDEKDETFQMPLTNARCSWRGYTDMSWANNRNGDYYSTERVYHLGIDIVGSDDTVYACKSGKVCASGYNSANGNYIILSHTVSGKTIYSFYAHLASRSVSVNQSVTRGQKIGEVGSSGSSAAGKHLHFAMMDTLWENGGYYGYSTYFTGNQRSYGNVTYYNPVYVIQNNRLP